jgi:hypothetical protein
MFQFEQQENTNFFHKPVKSAAHKPVSRNAVYNDATLTKSTVYNWYNQLKNSQVLPVFLISHLRHVLTVVRFLMGYSLVSEVYMPTFQNTLFDLHRQVGIENNRG